MRKIRKETSIEQLAAMICVELRKFNIEAVLVGGAVVSIYTLNEYQSFDLDFVLPGLAKDVSTAMKNLGFVKGKSRHWIHPESPFFVEFPGSILAIGDSTDVEVKEFTTPAGKIKLLSPTSSIMDRLASYYHWNDSQGLDQAVMIALKHPIDLKKIENWSKLEQAKEKFNTFRSILKRAKKQK